MRGLIHDELSKAQEFGSSEHTFFEAVVSGASSLVGRTLKEARVREQTGCSVVAVEVGGETIVNPPPDMPMPDAPDAEIIVIGTTESERAFHKRYAVDTSNRTKVGRV